MPRNSSITKLIINKTATIFLGSLLVWMVAFPVMSGGLPAPSNISKPNPIPKTQPSSTSTRSLRKTKPNSFTPSRKFRSPALPSLLTNQQSHCPFDKLFNFKYKCNKPLIKRCVTISTLSSQEKQEEADATQKAGSSFFQSRRILQPQKHVK